MTFFRILILTFAFLPCPLQAQQIDAILHDIEANNLQLQILRHEQRASILNMKADNVLNAPSIEYTPFYRKNYTGVASSELVVSAEFDFPTLYTLRNRQMHLVETANEQSYMIMRRDLLLEARMLCLDVVCQNQLIDMQSRHLAQAEEILSNIEKRILAGDATLLDLNKAKLDCMDIRKDIAQMKSDRSTLVMQLESLNGGNSVTLTETSFGEGDDELSDLSGLVIDEYADVALAQAEVSASAHELSLSRQAWLPSITVGYRRNTEENINMNGFLVGVSFPIFGNTSRVKSARMRHEGNELRLSQARVNVESELRNQFNELEGLRQVLDHTDIALLQETLELLGKALRHGEITTLQYYTETSDIYQKLQNHILLHASYAKLMTKILKNKL